jgi:hypothetical protein
MRILRKSSRVSGGQSGIARAVWLLVRLLKDFLAFLMNVITGQDG